MEKRLIVVAGPTAVGKTEAAIRLAERLGVPAIISADSRQCYRELSIGVARPSESQLARVPHYFVASHSIHQPINAAEYERLALGWLDDIFAQHDTAIVCGGTGLYIRALLDGVDEMPTVDEAVKTAVDAAFAEGGIAYLQDALRAEDPAFLQSGVDIQNPARLARALAFLRSTGESILAYQSKTRKQRDFQAVRLCLTLPRETLYARINARVDAMMEMGLLDEVRSLLPDRNLPALNTVGYAELFHFLEEKMTLPEAVEKIKQHTRNYAKRQETWFRNTGGWTMVEDLDEVVG